MTQQEKRLSPPSAAAVALPKISVITVVYNGVDELEQTMLSVTEQSYPNIEYIVIDGGSGDGTLDIIERYRERIDVLVSERDRGIYDAMNKGLALATGEWVNFMNCGDYFYDRAVIEQIVPDLRSEHVLVAGGYTMFSAISSASFEASPLAAGKMPSSHQSIFFNASAAKRFPYNTDYRVGADYDVVCRLVRANAGDIALSPVMVVRMNEVGFASANFNIWLKDYKKVIRRNHGALTAHLWTAKALIAKYLPGLVRLSPRRLLRQRAS